MIKSSKRSFVPKKYISKIKGFSPKRKYTRFLLRSFLGQLKRVIILLESQSNPSTYPLHSFDTYNRYLIRATVHRELFSDITSEREITIHLNNHRVIIPRVSRLRITCGGQNRLSFQQDKRDYFLNDCIIARLCLEEDTPPLHKLSVALVRKDEFRIKGGKAKLRNELIDFINLNTELKKSKENGGFFIIVTLRVYFLKGFIPFKLNLGRYLLEPTVRFQTPQMAFSIGYALKIRFQEDSGKGWSKEVRFNVWREHR